MEECRIRPLEHLRVNGTLILNACLVEMWVCSEIWATQANRGKYYKASLTYPGFLCVSWIDKPKAETISIMTVVINCMCQPSGCV